MLAKSSCSATPMARARTTIFPSLAPAETKNGKQVRDRTERQRRAAGKDERGQSDMEVGVAQRGQRRREVTSGADWKKSEATNKGSRNQGFHPGKDISMDSSPKGQIRNQSSDLNKAVLLLMGTGCVFTIQTTKKERKCC